MRRSISALAAALLLTASTGEPATADGPTTITIVGRASWYGAETCAGRRLCLTASGERFDPLAATCAHRTMRFGTWLEVTRVDTGAVAWCVVNDRGPAAWTGRVLDLSLGAMQQLSGVRAGVVPVVAVVVDGPPGLLDTSETEQETETDDGADLG